MAVTLPPSGYMSDNSRTKGEMKTSFEELRDAIDTVDTNTDDNTSDITVLSADVIDVQNDLAVHENDSVIHVTADEKSKIIYSPIVISTQAQFDNVFDGTTLSGYSIYISSNESPYQLNNDIPFGSNLKIDGDPGTTIERAGLYKFISVGTVGVPISSIHFTDNLTFDGIKSTYTITSDGGFANITYVDNSRFETKVKDCKTTGSGGAYYATIDTNTNCIIKNVDGCETDLEGGGVYGVYNSNISEISNCTALEIDGEGGGLKNCNWCTIHNIRNNEADRAGGGASECDNCMFTGDWSGNTTFLGTGVSGLYIHACDNSIAFAIADASDYEITTIREQILWS